MDHNFSGPDNNKDVRILYPNVVAFHRPAITFYVQLIVQDNIHAKAITQATFNKLFRPVIEKEHLEEFEGRLYEEASLQAMKFLYGEHLMHDMYEKEKERLEHFQIETCVLQDVYRHPEMYKKYLG